MYYLTLAATAALASATPALAAPKAPQALKSCEALAGKRIAADAIGLPTRGAIVTTSVRVPASEPRVENGEAILAIAAHCRVQGEIAGISAGAPPIRFNINLPLTWNGVAIQGGGGGMGGAVATAPGAKGSGMIDPDSPAQPYRLSTGYVTFGSDEGHGRGDLSFYMNDEAMRNWAADYIKKARDTAVALIREAYGTAPRRIYFSGESAGGRESVRAAQRFASDYDGFIATSPVLYWNINHIADNVTRSLLIDHWVDAAAIRVIGDTTRAACDAADGLKDGVVARYMECEVPRAAMRCADGKAGTNCLSDGQLAVLESLRRGWRLPAGLTAPYGITHFPGYGTTGDEDGPRYQYDFYAIGKVPPTRDLPQGIGFEPGRGAILNFGQVWVRYGIAQDPKFNPYNFDPLPYAKRIRYLSDLFEALDPDLSPLAARGAKLIIYEPSADNAAGLPPIAAYYRSVVAKMGQQGADRVMRFYVGPGGAHNVTGIGHVDLLKVMEAWVETGTTPPESLVAQEVNPATLQVTRSMPACRFPAYARYTGRGDPKSAANFRCVPRPALAAG